MRRRDLLEPGWHFRSRGLVPPAAAEPHTTPFDDGVVRKRAQDLAAKPFAAPKAKLPDALAHLTYDQHRAIRFDPTQALWRDQHLPFQVQFFHLGWLFTDRVDINEVAGGASTPIAYRPEMFDFGAMKRPEVGDLGFAGFRIHAPFVRPDYFDEVCVFLGASYFRAVAKRQTYGLSARGLSLKTGSASGEEFPLFREFWIERPAANASAIVVHALLDSQSAAGAYRFTIRPGDETVFDVESNVYPRVDLVDVGIATMTSMFYFDPSARADIDDYRQAVHDSSGLQIWTGRGERLWRQLANPHDLQISAFADTNPRGFGLMQRRRDFGAYQDLEAHYEKRPSLWAEPIGDSGDGAVTLMEIPTHDEIHDNVVGFWRPQALLTAQGEFRFTYRLHWCNDMAVDPALGRVLQTRAGTQAGLVGCSCWTCCDRLDRIGARRQASGGGDCGPWPRLQSGGAAQPQSGGWRASFELDPQGAKLSNYVRR